jgi:hypothetical protein
MSVEKFSSIFAGLDKAYGVYKIEKANTNGKHVGKATLVNKERTKKVWEGQAKAWQLELFQSTKTANVNGVASILMNTHLTTKNYLIKFERLSYHL